MAVQVTHIDDLKIAADDAGDGFDGFVSVAGGLARSSKRVWYNRDHDCWSIFNEIDESEEDYTDTASFLASDSTVVEALNVGALYSYS